MIRQLKNHQRCWTVLDSSIFVLYNPYTQTCVKIYFSENIFEHFEKYLFLSSFTKKNTLGPDFRAKRTHFMIFEWENIL